MGGILTSALVCGHIMFFMGPEQAGGEEVKGKWSGRRTYEEVTATSPPIPSLYPLPSIPSHHHWRERRRLLDHRPPREMETHRYRQKDRQTMKM